jgi:CRP-like cAMP-binding protein
MRLSTLDPSPLEGIDGLSQRPSEGNVCQRIRWTIHRLRRIKGAELSAAYKGRRASSLVNGVVMCILSSEPRTNHLIAGLPDDARQRWLPRLERVKLPQGRTLHESGSQMRYAYFPTTAVVSLVYEAANGASMEFVVVGNEGFVGAELLLGGGSTPSRAVVRTAGEALRMPAREMQDEFARGGSVARLLLRYTMALTTQVAQVAVCNRHHSLHQQLCRWLLMSLDRIEGDEIIATQEQIANLLGVRREGVTEAALHLQALGLIRYARGHILASDRHGLERQACECYAVVKREYDRLLPETLATPVLRALAAPRLVQTTASNDAPTPAVIAMAGAPQTQTRHSPGRTLAPPARAATAPNRARNARDMPAAHGISPGQGASAVTANRAPTAELAAEALAT